MKCDFLLKPEGIRRFDHLSVKMLAEEWSKSCACVINVSKERVLNARVPYIIEFYLHMYSAKFRIMDRKCYC